MHNRTVTVLVVGLTSALRE